MENKVHVDFREEESYLNYTIKYMTGHRDQIKVEKSKVDSAVDYSLSHYNDENAEQYNELVINLALQNGLKSKENGIERSLKKPYFARVDFTEGGRESTQRLYIGKMSLLDEAKGRFLVVDWRAPISTLYYEGRIGEASYECPDGKIKGRINLKRQYSIEDAKLIDIFDIDITTNDEFLQASLNSLKDNRLKDIVSTIQEEQNRVIRANMWKPLIVQGAAGGGKTTIALHRIAYLLYNNELDSKRFMIIAPNRFFLSYISDVLPELGVEEVLQNTFEDFALEIIGEKLDVIEPALVLESILNGNSKLAKESQFKSSLTFKTMLDHYIKVLENKIIKEEDFKVEDYILFSYKDIQKLFVKEYSYLPFEKRKNEIKKNLLNKLKREKKLIMEDIELHYEDKINAVRRQYKKDCLERREKIITLANEREETLKKAKNKMQTMVSGYIKNIEIQSSVKYYIDFLESLRTYKEGALTSIIDNTLSNLNYGKVSIEDLAPLMYIKYKTWGLEEKINLKHIVIDEAQDFSLFQLSVLKEILNSSSLTILGDLCQGIYSYRGVNNWNDVNKLIFNGEAQMMSLEQSYRTTIEVMESAKEVLKTLEGEYPLPKPVIRHGDEVTIDKVQDFNNLVNNLAHDLKNNKFKSIALICKDIDECNELYKELKKVNIKCTVIKGGEKEYSGGVVVIPCHLVKGLEFDWVIICNCSKDNYKNNTLDTKLLYVAMTRPIHKLSIYYIDEKSELIEGV